METAQSLSFFTFLSSIKVGSYQSIADTSPSAVFGILMAVTINDKTPPLTKMKELHWGFKDFSHLQ